MNIQLNTPTAAAIPGFRLRTLRGEADAEGVYAVRAGSAERDGIDPLSISESVPTLEALHLAYAEAAAAGALDQRFVAEVDERIVGYGLIEPWHEGDGRWVYLVLGWVLPEWRGRGIGTVLLHEGEARARRMAAADHPGEPFELAGNASSTEKESTALLLNEGYYVGYTVVELQLRDGNPPPISPLALGLELRPATPDHIPAIARSIVESYANEYPGGRFQEEATVEENEEGLRAARHDLSLWQVAWDGSEIVGQVIPVVYGERAHFYEVSVRPAWRRRGVARALLTRALHDLRGRGVRVIRVRTIAEFPTSAVSLYRSVGFEVVKKFPRYRKAA